MITSDQSPGTGEYYRTIGGRVSDSIIRTGPTVKLETVARQANEPMIWRWRQPAVTLICWDRGHQHFDVDVEGVSTHVDKPARGTLGLFPSGARATGEYHAEPFCDYHVAFINPDFIEERSREIFQRSLVGFQDAGLEQGLRELTSWRDDATFALMAEGWALQTIARLRMRLDESVAPPIREARLSNAVMRRLEDYISSHLTEPIGITELAVIADLSPRHFARLFRVTTGMSPARFVHRRRLELATTLLARKDTSVTEIAFACGFSHSQHFANSFRRAMGVSPSEYRREVRD